MIYCKDYDDPILDDRFYGDQSYQPHRYPSCNHCPRINDTISNRWCNGNCVFDKADQICKEGKCCI